MREFVENRLEIFAFSKNRTNREEPSIPTNSSSSSSITFLSRSSMVIEVTLPFDGATILLSMGCLFTMQRTEILRVNPCKNPIFALHSLHRLMKYERDLIWKNGTRKENKFGQIGRPITGRAIFSGTRDGNSHGNARCETVSAYLAVGRGARARSSERLDFSPGWTRPRWFVVTEGGPLSRAVTAQSRANQEDDEGPR